MTTFARLSYVAGTSPRNIISCLADHADLSLRRVMALELVDRPSDQAGIWEIGPFHCPRGRKRIRIAPPRENAYRPLPVSAYGCTGTRRSAGATRDLNRSPAVSARTEIPTNTRGYPNCTKRIPAPAIAQD